MESKRIFSWPISVCFFWFLSRNYRLFSCEFATGFQNAKCFLCVVSGVASCKFQEAMVLYVSLSMVEWMPLCQLIAHSGHGVFPKSFLVSGGPKVT